MYFKYIKDPKKYEAKLVELKTQVDAYKEVVEAVVKLAEVNEYTTSIQEKEQKTKVLLEQAERDVKSIITNAQQEAETIKLEVSVLKQEAASENKEVKLLKKQLKDQMQKAIDDADALTKAQQELRTRRMEVEAQASDLSARLEKLKSVMQ